MIIFQLLKISIITKSSKNCNSTMIKLINNKINKSREILLLLKNEVR